MSKYKYKRHSRAICYSIISIIMITLTSLSRISQLKIPGFSFLYSSILFSTLVIKSMILIMVIFLKQTHLGRSDPWLWPPYYSWPYTACLLVPWSEWCDDDEGNDDGDDDDDDDGNDYHHHQYHHHLTATDASPANDDHDEVDDGLPVEDLRDASVADPQLPADHTGSHPGRSHLDDLESDVVGEGAPIDEHPAQLVDPTLALEWVTREESHFGLHFELFNSPTLRFHFACCHRTGQQRGRKCAGRGPGHHWGGGGGDSKEEVANRGWRQLKAAPAVIELGRRRAPCDVWGRKSQIICLFPSLILILPSLILFKGRAEINGFPVHLTLCRTYALESFRAILLCFAQYFKGLHSLSKDCIVFQMLAQSFKCLHSLSKACTVSQRLSESFKGFQSVYESLRVFDGLLQFLTDLEFLTNLEFRTDFCSLLLSLGRCKVVHCTALCDKSCVKGWTNHLAAIQLKPSSIETHFFIYMV